MAVFLIHSPQTPSILSGDQRDYQSATQVNNSIIASSNAASHTLIGATPGDLLIALSATAIGSTQAPSLTGPLLLGDGTSTAPAYAFASQPNMGFYRASTNNIYFPKSLGVGGFGVGAVLLQSGAGIGIVALPSLGKFTWTATANEGNAADTGLSRTAAATVAVGNGTQGDASGTVNCASYQAGGTAGVASFGPAGVVSITIKGGLVVAVS